MVLRKNEFLLDLKYSMNKTLYFEIYFWRICSVYHHRHGNHRGKPGNPPFQMGESPKSVNQAIIFAKHYYLRRRNIQMDLQL